MKRLGGPEWSREMRTMALLIDPVSAELAPTPYLPRVFGVVMDITPKNSWASVVVIADITTSMYFGVGIGFVRMEKLQIVADASKELLLVAERHVEAFDPNPSVDLPGKDRTRITILTHEGRLVVDAPDRDLSDPRHPVAPVHYAVHKVITMIRLSQKGPSRPTLEGGATAVMGAAGVGNVGALLKWIELGTNLEMRDDRGYTALMFAANLGREESVRILLDHGADPNATDNQRSTPLMFAAQHGHDGIVSQLLAAGASPNARGDHGLTPLDFARRHNHASTASLLLGAGAIDADAKSSE